MKMQKEGKNSWISFIIFIIVLGIVSFPVLAAPAITSANPANNAVNVPVTPISISAVFNETMDAATINYTSVILRDQTGALITSAIGYNAATRTVSINPWLPSLRYNTDYTAVIMADVRNALGITLSQPYSWTFHTPVLVTTVTPAIISANPADGATDIPTDMPNISVTFNSDIMDPTTMTTATVLLKDQSNNPVSIFVGSYDSINRKLSINPWNVLGNYTTYTATVTTGVKDWAGTPMAQDYSWSFTTGVPTPVVPPPIPSNFAMINSSASAGGSISPSGIFYVPPITSQTFISTPDAGFHLISVVINGVNYGARSPLTYSPVSGNLTVVANFAANSATNDILATAGPGGSITPSGIVPVPFGTNQTFTWIPEPGFRFFNISVDGKSIYVPSSNYTFTNVMDPHTINVNFIENSFTITSSAGPGGSISPLGKTVVPTGGMQCYNIAPSAGNRIIDILVDGVSKGIFYTYCISNVMANHTISAVFSSNAFTITSTAGPNGTISPLGATTVGYAGTQFYSITPAIYHRVADVLVDGVSVGPVTNYTFTNVRAAHTIDASFVINTSSLPLTLAPVANQTAFVNRLLSFSLLGSGNGSPLTYFLGPFAPVGASVNPNTGIFTWTPLLVGNFAFTALVTDGTTILSTPVNVAVSIMPPTIAQVPAQTGMVGSVLSFNVSATPGSGSTLTYSLDATAPIGAAIDPISGMFSWSPTSAGNFSFNVIANDGMSNATAQVNAIISSDTIPPVITMNGVSPINVAFGSVYTDAGATATDNVDLTVTVNSASTVNTATIGAYTVTYTAMDTAGNNATPVIRTVNVVDMTAPVITVLGSNPATVFQNATYTDAGATAIDNVDGAVTVVTTGTVDTTTLGTYTITYTATDAAFNTVTATRTVNVVAVPDTISPVITILGSNPVNVTQNTAYVDAGATALDNVDGAVTASIITTNLVNTAVIGAYAVTYNVSDLAGNSAQAVRVVNVVAAASVCQTTADTNGDGTISNLEILTHISKWKQGLVPNLEILKAISLWKAGTGC